jgi:hypothetical protein
MGRSLVLALGRLALRDRSRGRARARPRRAPVGRAAADPRRVRARPVDVFAKVRALTRIDGVEREQELLDLARHATAGQLERLVRAYRGVIATEQTAAGERPQRWLAWTHDDDGSLLVRARLPAEEGALVHDRTHHQRRPDLPPPRQPPHQPLPAPTTRPHRRATRPPPHDRPRRLPLTLRRRTHGPRTRRRRPPDLGTTTINRTTRHLNPHWKSLDPAHLSEPTKPARLAPHCVRDGAVSRGSCPRAVLRRLTRGRDRRGRARCALSPCRTPGGSMVRASWRPRRPTSRRTGA